jgi:hypothetical protein
MATKKQTANKRPTRKAPRPDLEALLNDASKTTPLNYQNIPVEIVIPEDQYTDYADAFAVAYTSEEFVISFLQLQHPLAVNQERLNEQNRIETVCIARIALTPTRMIAFIEALHQSVGTRLATAQAVNEAMAQASNKERG